MKVLAAIARCFSCQLEMLTRVILILAVGFLSNYCCQAVAHEGELTDGLKRNLEQNGELANRLRRVKALRMHVMDPGVAQRGLFKVRRTQLELRGVPDAEIANRLIGGPNAAFPFVAQPELLSTGDLKTLTILIDFQDIAAPPVPTQQDFQANIYGTGTPTAGAFKPYDSVREYYRRASNGKAALDGNVLGWHHFPNNRSNYAPQYSPGMTDRQKMEVDNRANFRLFKEALSALDATHDFSQYDNDNDGDIDLVTILYAGPPEGWGSFWWAYRWAFYPSLTPEASTTTFDGKRMNQFVFQFIDVRTGTQDFNPLTLIHEMGHAFGLPDYYDYDYGQGESGGVGDLDIMDANWGNHNAFSRWLLDWITPEIVGDAGTQTFKLEAAGRSDSDPSVPEAVAIFPGISSSMAPEGELFMIENRHPIGNDGLSAQMPGEGCLIWHVDATPDAFGRDFRFNNSYTRPKLIRLVRADKVTDFGDHERATAATYFQSHHSFTPTSLPSSASNDGAWTGVQLRVMSDPGEVITVLAGIDPSGPSPAVAIPTMTAMHGIPSPAASESNTTAAADEPVQPEEPPAEGPSKLDELLALSAKLDRATPDQLTKRLSDLLEQAKGESYDLAELKIVVSKLASKDGKAAMEQVVKDVSPKLQQQLYPLALEGWMQQRPEVASQWYLKKSDVGGQEVPAGPSAGRRFSAMLSAYVAGTDPKAISKVIEASKTAEELTGVSIGFRAQEVPKANYSKPFGEKLRSLNLTTDEVLHFDETMFHELHESIEGTSDWEE